MYFVLSERIQARISADVNVGVRNYVHNIVFTTLSIVHIPYKMKEKIEILIR